MNIHDVVPSPRLARYQQVSGADVADLGGFYIWCQELALAVFADIATLEVAMRSAMARELSAAFGNEWYARPDLFDDDATRSLSTAWNQGGLGALRAAPNADLDVVEGKLVAALMFGFWVQLLSKGSYAGKAPLRQRRVYDTLLWRPALVQAFPHAASRRDTQRAAEVVRVARNRIAHHEHIAWGVPLPGQNRRLSVTDVHAEVLTLASWISPETAAWIRTHSRVATTIGSCPAGTNALLL